ncbi:MAG TPA: hypothetical protein VG308_16280 [Stellaceae bacterium]|jgi:hypothetical protein|nr:hypothetical protein [Stellaceae bacterium]
MRRRLWLLALVLYALAGIADGAHRLAAPPTAPGAPTGFAANLAVAFCAGLFWPIDIVVRPLLTR